MQITIEIDSGRIDNAIASAHCSYWANELVWNGKTGYVVESEGPDGKPVRHRLSLASVKRGVSELARVSSYIFGKLLADDLDGPMSDVLLQLCAGVVRTDKGHEGGPKYG